MSELKSLQVLAEPGNREAILLAEIGMLLHNLGKLSWEFAWKFAAEQPKPTGFDYQHIAGVLLRHVDEKFPNGRGHPVLGTRYKHAKDEPQTARLLSKNLKDFLWETTITLPAPFNDRTEYHLGDFIAFQDKWWYEESKGKVRIEHLFDKGSLLTQVGQLAHHGASGGEKEGSEIGAERQPIRGMFIATAYGYENRLMDVEKLKEVRTGLVEKLQTAVKDNIIGNYREIVGHLREEMSGGLGDTQRALNDITLWDLSSGAAALFKAAAAYLLLGEQWDGDEEAALWRLLYVRLDGLQYLGRAHHITDLLGRYDALQRALDGVRDLLEVTFPLGNEVYRDENGSVFVVPNFANLLDDFEGQREETELPKSLRALIHEAFAQASDPDNSPLAGELCPQLDLVGPYPGRQINLREVTGLPLPPLQSNPEQVRRWWETGGQDEKGANREICTICRLRPEAYGVQHREEKERAAEGHVCGICLQRRQKRVAPWLSDEGRQGTVWLDEVCDANGRIALIVGRFDLEKWLAGPRIQTMYSARVKVDDSAGDRGGGGEPRIQTMYSAREEVGIPKTASFARIRRCWETTQRFWQEMTDQVIPRLLGNPGERLEIQVGRDLPKLKNRHVYDARVGERTLGLVWDRTNKRLITTDNIAYLRGLVGENVAGWIARQGRLGLANPAGYGQPRWRPLVEVAVNMDNVRPCPPNYTPHIPLLTQPLTFMLLVPAAEAMRVIEAIRAKYTVELGKVRNRLPMHLGLIVFPRRTPIYAVIDAGRRMLRMMTAEQEGWQVYEVSDLSAEERERLWQQSRGGVMEEEPPGVLAQVKRLTLKPEPERAPTVLVPVALGNGATDHYHPAFRVTKFLEPAGYRPCVKREDGTETEWAFVGKKAVRGDLGRRKHYTIAYHPSLFDFEFLDTTTRRFEVSYDDSGLRRGRATRPYLLEELDTLADIWKLLADADQGLTDTQISNLQSLLMTRVERWAGGDIAHLKDDGEFKEYVQDTFINVRGLKWWQKELDTEKRNLLWRAGCDGTLFDVLELYQQILKRKSERQGQSTRGG